MFYQFIIFWIPYSWDENNSNENHTKPLFTVLYFWKWRVNLTWFRVIYCCACISESWDSLVPWAQLKLFVPCFKLPYNAPTIDARTINTRTKDYWIDMAKSTPCYVTQFLLKSFLCHALNSQLLRTLWQYFT